MTSDPTTFDWLTPALTALQSGREIVTAVVIGPDDHPLLGARAVFESTASNKMEIQGTSLSLARMLDGPAHNIRTQRQAVTLDIDTSTLIPDSRTARVFISWYGPPESAWIFGAGHIAQALAPLLKRLGYHVTIADDRDEYVAPLRFPDADRLLIDEFPTLAAQCAESTRPWVILVTRGHQHDEQILRKLAGCHPAYIGMIGSKRRVLSVTRRLKSEGIPSGLLNRLHAPIGLPIGADSPNEIAVSIAAELIAIRRGAHSTESRMKAGHMADTTASSELWTAIQKMRRPGQTVVIATIVDRQGSTPRGLGAQMAIFADGTTQGTIGGGCGEQEIKTHAKHLMLTGGPAHLTLVDLTGDPQAESADICGGRYSVFLERYPD